MQQQQGIPGIVVDEDHAYPLPIVQRAVADMTSAQQEKFTQACADAEVAMLEERIAEIKRVAPPKGRAAK